MNQDTKEYLMMSYAEFCKQMNCGTVVARVTAGEYDDVPYHDAALDGDVDDEAPVIDELVAQFSDNIKEQALIRDHRELFARMYESSLREELCDEPWEFAADLQEMLFDRGITLREYVDELQS